MKNILLFIVILSLYNNATAQMSIGAKAGYTRAQENYGNVFLPPNPLIHIHSYNVASTIYLPITHFLLLGIEPGYIQRGASCIPGFSDFRNDSRLYFHSIDVPMRILYQLPIWKNKLNLRTKVGYGIDFTIAAQESKQTDAGWTAKTKIQLDNFNQINHGFNGGIGIGIPIGKGQIIIETDYIISMSNATNISVSKNRNWNLDIGYSIDLSKSIR